MPPAAAPPAPDVDQAPGAGPIEGTNPMGKLIPMADYVGDPDGGSPWFHAPNTDWDPCAGCPIRSACREVRECHDGDVIPHDAGAVPDVALHLVPPPDIVA